MCVYDVYVYMMCMCICVCVYDVYVYVYDVYVHICVCIYIYTLYIGGAGMCTSMWIPAKDKYGEVGGCTNLQNP